MFGMGMGMGGRRNPSMRYLRIGALVLILLAGVVFHHSGKTYDSLRVLYYVLIIGLIAYSFRARRSIGQSGGFNSVGARFGRPGGQGWASRPGAQAPVDARLREPEPDPGPQDPGAS